MTALQTPVRIISLPSSHSTYIYNIKFNIQICMFRMLSRRPYATCQHDLNLKVQAVYWLHHFFTLCSSYASLSRASNYICSYTAVLCCITMLNTGEQPGWLPALSMMHKSESMHKKGFKPSHQQCDCLLSFRETGSVLRIMWYQKRLNDMSMYE